ncbi:MAG: DNA double-strand break repair nuclease NurA [Anaerolineaceae bacterium]|nr:DNA double-strand break repair nuclease NurA [Anaerolineaceae bacterium]
MIGYIDTSYASDFVTMLTRLFGIKLQSGISDAGLLRSQMSWGDRSLVYICARDDNVLEKYYDQVCFSYLKTTAENPPARLDFPRWIYEEDIHEQVFDIVRAESVVGIGYPYVLETADAVAVLTMEDRERFYRLFQEFAAKQKLPLRFSKKSLSKRGRRV